MLKNVTIKKKSSSGSTSNNPNTVEIKLNNRNIFSKKSLFSVFKKKGKVWKNKNNLFKFILQTILINNKLKKHYETKNSIFY